MNSALTLWPIVTVALGCALITSAIAGPAVAEAPGDNRPKSLLEVCRGASPPTRNDAERWAWLRICQGQVADFNEQEGRSQGKELDPSEASGWTNSREVSVDFLKTILLSEPYRSQIRNTGAYFRGAWVKDRLDLENAKLPDLVALEWSRIESDVDLTGTRSEYPVYLDHAYIRGKFKANSSHFGPFTMPFAMIGGDLELTGTHIDGYWWASSLNVKGNVAADLVHVEGHVLLDNAEFRGPANLENITVGASLDIVGGKFATLDLNGSSIHTELRLAKQDDHSGKVTSITFEDPDGKYVGQPRLLLQSASVGSWRGPSGNWPLMNLAGFGYSYFTIFGLKQGASLGEWGVSWLKSDVSGSSQPYEQYATTISKIGFESEATEVLFAERQKVRSQSSGLPWLVLTGSRLLTGYGFGEGYFNGVIPLTQV